MKMSDVVAFTHMLPTPLLVDPQVGGVALLGLEAALIFVVFMYSSAVTIEELALTLGATAKRP
jgi:hypothetical protein